MDNLCKTIAGGFAHYFQDFRRRIHLMDATMSDVQFWTKPFPYGNSFGNLVLHLSGNLNYYIGNRIEDTGYVRNRPREFESLVGDENTLGEQRVQALADLDRAVEMVIRSVERQREEDWSSPYGAAGVDDVPDRFQMFLRCCIHFHHHIGQMTYIVKQWDSKPSMN